MNRVLIANRGEIALRIIRTCQKLNLETVAIFSEADRELPFVKEADHAFSLGESHPQKSYLNIERIMQAIRDSGADAVHPGYGFLSENPAFAREIEKAGITFIGPDPSIIDLMGDKVKARLTMQAAGVPVVPGSDWALEDAHAATRLADKIGYPVMLKASAGGGGIGMQLCTSSAELEAAFQSNQKRAQTYFGRPDMFLEKAIENGRHVEVQIFGDSFGHIVHLYERDCSVQRRNQKVIEESPSPFISETTREKITAAASAAGKHVGYTNAGTVEFIVDEAENFYFLEMNTRLQVEHPVTEAITGDDLVEWQIDVAQGKPLSKVQTDIHAQGHAIEYRLYAEDPVSFLPSPGKIRTLTWPNINDVRIDDGYQAGSTVTPFYDPMIAKIIIRGDDRSDVLAKSQYFFDQLTVDGIKTNAPLFKKLLSGSEFSRGHYTTHMLHDMKEESQ
ncbi:acetyl-CoA carboxylase biotin carboxylase subunit [Tuberibacillus sp. Marseille-P3662]|uniref:acetyl-CoA carboxylase biotin carboxylase subunit n=1 Tax=Tuberibacillus sp. Marseille-P3662 TaxID=1965358 RepID=UPI000A1CC86D|nr:acetyl-CoA carboxylase biotin carboxylase subunit [Tuberibacillus sp. Marseille-P3662]